MVGYHCSGRRWLLRGVRMSFQNKASAPSEAMISNARRYNKNQAGKLWTVRQGIDPGSRQFALAVFAYQGFANKDCPPPNPGSALANECNNVSNERVCCGNIDGMLGPRTLRQMMTDSRAGGADITNLQYASLAEWALAGGVPAILNTAYDSAGARGSIARFMGLSDGTADVSPEPMRPAEPKSRAGLFFGIAVVLFVVYQSMDA